MKTWRMTACTISAVIALFLDPARAQSPPDLGSAGSLAILAGTTVTCTGGIVTGDVAVAPGGSVGACTVTGTIHIGDPLAQQAYADFLVAYSALSPQAGETHSIQNGTLAGLTLRPGVYWLDDSAKTGLLTLDGLGNPNAVWIFKSGTSGSGSLTANSFDVVMAGGGDPCASGARVFWWSAQAAVLTDSSFVGTILAGTSLTVTNGNFVGQGLAEIAVTLTTPGSFIACGSPQSCTPPGAFSQIAPVDGAVDQSSTNLLLDWTDSTGAATFDLYLGTTTPPPLFQSNLAASQLIVPTLTMNTTYYWQVTSTNGCAPDARSAVWSFRTGTPCIPPEAPQLKGPSNGGSAGEPVPVTLSWYAAANATSYDVYLGPQSGNLALIGTTTDLSWVVEGLYPGTPYCWMISARNECGSANSEVWCFETAGAPETADALFVVAAHAPGALGSNWVTDTMIFNGGDHPVPYHFYFTPGGQDGTSTPVQFSGTIETGHSVMNHDIILSLYGLSNSVGNLRLESDDPLYLTSRTYNLTPVGTYGQFVAGLPAGSGVGACTLPVGEKGQLLGVQQSESYRTNLGVLEVMGRDTTFAVRFYDSTGTLIHSSPGMVRAYSWWQMGASNLGVPLGENLRAEFEVTSGGAVLSYASVVDHLTNDAFFVPAQKVSDSALLTHQLVAVVARSGGAMDSAWRSNVYLYNPTASSQTVTMQFYSSAAPVSNFVRLLPGRIVEVDDVVSALFGQLTGDVAGSLHLTAAAGLLAISDTYDETENGTFGQFIPARAGADLLGVSETGHILQLSSNTSYRCNIGFSEYSGVASQLQLTIFDVDGRQLGTAPFRVGPYANVQIGDSFRILGISGDVDAARAEVKVISGGSIYAYASVVDNRTGDAIFVPALEKSSHPRNPPCP
jgi:hypothetical protein